MNKHLLLTAITLGLSSAIVWTVLTQIDPYGAYGGLARGLLVFGVLCGVGAFMTMIFFFAGELVVGRQLGLRGYIVSVRRGLLVGVLAAAVVGLRLANLMGVFEGVLLGLFLLSIELLFVSSSLSRERRRVG